MKKNMHRIAAIIFKSRKRMSGVFLGVLGFVLLAVFAMPQSGRAQNSLTLSITPPFFQLSISPGEFWASSIKVANPNPYELTIYASVVNFAVQGEEGQGKFLPLLTEEGTDDYSLGSWIEISSEPVVIPVGKSKEIPFSFTPTLFVMGLLTLLFFTITNYTSITTAVN